MRKARQLNRSPRARWIVRSAERQLREYEAGAQTGACVFLPLLHDPLQPLARGIPRLTLPIGQRKGEVVR
jgi:hypothetical protein